MYTPWERHCARSGVHSPITRVVLCASLCTSDHHQVAPLRIVVYHPWEQEAYTRLVVHLSHTGREVSTLRSMPSSHTGREVSTMRSMPPSHGER